MDVILGLPVECSSREGVGVHSQQDTLPIPGSPIGKTEESTMGGMDQPRPVGTRQEPGPKAQIQDRPFGDERRVIEHEVNLEPAPRDSRRYHVDRDVTRRQVQFDKATSPRPSSRLRIGPVEIKTESEIRQTGRSTVNVNNG